MFLPFFILLFPEEPLDLFRYVKVEDDSETYKPPPVAKPDHPKHIQQSPECELCPLVTGEGRQVHYLTELIEPLEISPFAWLHLLNPYMMYI